MLSFRSAPYFQIEAYIGRSTPLDDRAYYAIISRLDNEILVATQALHQTDANLTELE